MTEITFKNKSIAQLSRKNIDLQSNIDKSKIQLKGISEDNVKCKYKIDKIQISLEERENRVALYQDIFKKKMSWNQELENKVVTLELDLQNQRRNLREMERD